MAKHPRAIVNGSSVLRAFYALGGQTSGATAEQVAAWLACDEADVRRFLLELHRERILKPQRRSGKPDVWRPWDGP